MKEAPAEVPEEGAVAIQGCLRQSLSCFLVDDEVEVSGRRGRVVRLHEDRTCTFVPLAGGPEAETRVLLSDCTLLMPKGNFCRKRKELHRTDLLTWHGRCALDWQGRTNVSAPVGREGVHNVVCVAASQPIPAGHQVIQVDMEVTGMDQGWGNSGDSGLLLYCCASGQSWEETLQGVPILKVTYDHPQHPSHHLSVILRCDSGTAPHWHPGGRGLVAVLQCPQYGGWLAHVTAIKVQLHHMTITEEPGKGFLPADWADYSTAAFDHLWGCLEDGALLSIDPTHLSLQGQERQHVWPQASGAAPANLDPGPVMPRLVVLVGNSAASPPPPPYPYP